MRRRKRDKKHANMIHLDIFWFFIGFIISSVFITNYFLGYSNVQDLFTKVMRDGYSNSFLGGSSRYTYCTLL